MDKLNVEQTENTANPVATENESGGVQSNKVSYGKFKDAESLLTAYNALESEFTKRCQKIKELESALTAVDKEKPPTQAETAKPEQTLDKQDVLKDYIKELLEKKQTAIVLDGVGMGVKTPTERPKTFKQAGQLAKEYFNN